MKRFCLVMLYAMFVLAGQVHAADPGVSDKEILIGSSLVLEGPASVLGIQTNHGMKTWINQVNDQGGVNGRLIKVIEYNDSYEPLPCVNNTRRLIQDDKVFALACYVGTPTSVKSQKIWVDAKVPVVGFFTGADALRTPFSRYNIHIRASYYQEAAAAVDVFVNRLGFKKIAIFYQYDAFGEAVKKGAEIALEKSKMVPVAYGNFPRNTLEIENGLKAIVAAAPDAVVMVGTYAPLAKFVKAAKKAGLSKTLFYTVSFVGPEALAKELGADVTNCIVTQVVPPYDASELPVVKEYKKLLKKYYPGDAPNFVSLEGFVNARVLVEGLKRAGKDLTRENFIHAIESIKGDEIGMGLSLSYGAEDHQGMDKVYITQVIGGRYTEVNDWKSVLK